jgi:hypothetical protein
MLLCHTGLRPATQAKPGLGTLAPLSLSHIAHACAKVPLCPAITPKATIVLPDFIRSCSTDGARKIASSCHILSLSIIARSEAIPKKILMHNDHAEALEA